MTSSPLANASRRNAALPPQLSVTPRHAAAFLLHGLLYLQLFCSRRCDALPPIGAYRERMLDATTCTRVRHKAFDRTLTNDVPHKQALILKHVRVIGAFVKDLPVQNVSLSIPSACLIQLDPPPEAEGVAVSMHSYSWAEHNATTDQLRPAEAECVKAPGTWFLLSDRGHGQDNVFEELNAVWYPVFLMARLAGNLSAHELRMTFLGGHLKHFLAFDEVYRMLGHHIPWTMIAQRGGITRKARPNNCTEFERVLVAGADWSWIDAPVVARRNVALTRFVSALLGSLGIGHVHPPRCQPKLLYTVRHRGYRQLVNEQEMLDSVATALPKFTLAAEELAGRPLFEQLSMVRSASIFMFSHGGAGPLLLFLFPGAVVVELFPFDFADPMYRNLAVMTGKVYLSWQNRDASRAMELERLDRNSNTLVDIPAVLAVLQTAAAVTANNLLDAFLSLDRTPYMRGLCPWCSPEQRNFTCDPRALIVPRAATHFGEDVGGTA